MGDFYRDHQARRESLPLAFGVWRLAFGPLHISPISPIGPIGGSFLRLLGRTGHQKSRDT
jgi:hypothetical protein